MTIRGLLESCAMRIPNNVALRWSEGKEWHFKTWSRFLQDVRETAEGYATRFGLKPREENVAIILSNHPMWMVSYLAQAGAGLAVVPVDPVFSVPEEGMSDMCHMGADLVGPAREQLHFQEGKIGAAVKDAVGGQDLLCPCVGGIPHAHAVIPFLLFEVGA